MDGQYNTNIVARGLALAQQGIPPECKTKALRF